MKSGSRKVLKILYLIILLISSITPTILRGIQQVKVNENVVPVIFRDLPTHYHMFVVSTVFAFMGAYSALVFQRKHKPRIELFCGIYAMASMFSALAIVLEAAALWFVAPSPPLSATNLDRAILLGATFA